MVLKYGSRYQGLVKTLRIPNRQFQITNHRSNKTYSKGEIPHSLLLKQEQRLSEGHEGKKVDASQQVLFSLEEILNLFKPNAMTEEDEDLTRKQYQTRLQQFIVGPEFTNLLRSKFGFNDDSDTIQKDSLVKNFKLLSPMEYDAVIHFVKDPKFTTEEWSKIPIFVKQLQYFCSFGPFGPRNKSSFNESPFYCKLEEKNLLSKIIIGLLITITSIGFVKNELRKQDKSDQK